MKRQRYRSERSTHLKQGVSVSVGIYWRAGLPPMRQSSLSKIANERQEGTNTMRMPDNQSIRLIIVAVNCVDLDDSTSGSAAYLRAGNPTCERPVLELIRNWLTAAPQQNNRERKRHAARQRQEDEPAPV